MEKEYLLKMEEYMQRIRNFDYKRVKDIIGQDYMQWKAKEAILIDSQTGRGKTTFILEILSPYADTQNKNILFLVNRTAIKESVTRKIRRLRIKNVKVETYQSIESNFTLKNRLENLINSYDYIVADEAHHFFADCEFNLMTESSLRWITEQNEKNIVIFMSATCFMLKKYFQLFNIRFKSYELNGNYDYIENFNFYYSDDVIQSVISNKSDDEKILYFTSARVGKKLEEESDDVSFICSKHNKNYRVNEELWNYIINKESFPKKILTATTAIDTGINIEDARVKTIIVDVGVDLDTIQQCIGRKRIQSLDDKISLYIKIPSVGMLNKYLNEANELLEPVEYFKENNFEMYCKKYYNQPFNNLFRPIDGVLSISRTLGMKQVMIRRNCENWINGSSSMKFELEERLGLRGEILNSVIDEINVVKFNKIVSPLMNLILYPEDIVKLKDDLKNAIGKPILNRNENVTTTTFRDFAKYNEIEVERVSGTAYRGGRNVTTWTLKST
jgi:hypothetical protein